MIKKLISTAIVSSVIGSASANPELGYMMLDRNKHQFFNATIAIDALPAELADKALKVRLGSITDFYRHNIEYDKQLSSLRFKITKDSNGKPLIRVRSIREITASKLKAVVKLTVGNHKIYGIYDVNLTSNQERYVTLNLLNSDHKPAEKRFTTKANYSSQNPLSASARKATLYGKNGKDINIPSHEQYPVTAGQSLSRIAMELLPRYPEVKNWQTLMNRMAALNPEAFINGDINKLRADAKLKLPGPSQKPEPATDRPETAGWESLDHSRNDEPVMAQNQTGEASPDIPTGKSLNSTIIMHDLPAELAGNENLKVRLGSITDFYRQGIDYKHQVAHLRFEITANSNKETVIRAYSVRDISARHLTAVVKLSAGRKKVYGIYELRSDKTGPHVAFTLLDINNRRVPQLVKHSSVPTEDHTASAPASGEIAKKQALEALRDKLMGYEQSPDHRGSQPKSNIRHGRKWNRSLAEENNRYRVSQGDTLSTIAVNLVRAYPAATSWRAVMKLLVMQNPDAFIHGDINKIRTGTLLTLPENSHFDQLYTVAAGDSISMIAWKLQYKYPQPGGWKEMMKRLIRMNPEAFINGNPHKLRENEFLIIPGAGSFESETDIQALPGRQQWNTYHQIDLLQPGQGIKSASFSRNKAPSLQEPSIQAPSVQKPSVQKLSDHKPLIQEKAETTYQVTENESLAAIAHKLMPDYPQFDSWYDLLQELAKLNPSVFANNDIGAIKEGTLLQLPEKKSRKHQTDYTTMQLLPAENHDAEEKSSRRQSDSSVNNVVASSYNKISKSLLSRISHESSYAVPDGYTISMVAIKLFPRFPEYENWPALMDAIYKLNPDAFIDSDINRLRANSRLKLPHNISS